MMRKTRELDNILDECLERLLTGDATIEQCLAWYPEYAAEIESLLRAALVARDALAIKPRPEFRERARYQFQAAVRDMVAKKSRGFLDWQPRWATAVIVVVVLLLAGSGTVAAAGSSLPDEPLYQVKLASEAVRLTLTPSDMGKAELYAELADKRVDEIIKMADKGNVEQVERVTQRLNSELMAVANLTLPAGEELAVAATSGSAPLPAATEETTQLQAPAPTTALAPTRAPVEVTPPPSVSMPKAPGPPEEAGQDKGGVKQSEGKNDEQAKLKMTLSRHAAENQEALQKELERAPESIKPALRQAIEKANAGYERALRNLD